jgi:hypothetical protein
MRCRWSSLRKGAGASSTSFWLRRCSEQSRVPSDHATVRVLDDLGLDMARPVEELLDEALAASECADRFAHRRFVELGDLVEAPRDLQPPTAASESRLDRDRQTMLLGEGQHLRGLSDGLRGPLDQLVAYLYHDFACLDLVA